MGKAAQEKAKFRWYDTTRYEVSNKVSTGGENLVPLELKLGHALSYLLVFSTKG